MSQANNFQTTLFLFFYVTGGSTLESFQCADNAKFGWRNKCTIKKAHYQFLHYSFTFNLKPNNILSAEHCWKGDSTYKDCLGELFWGRNSITGREWPHFKSTKDWNDPLTKQLSKGGWHMNRNINIQNPPHSSQDTKAQLKTSVSCYLLAYKMHISFSWRSFGFFPYLKLKVWIHYQLIWLE